MSSPIVQDDFGWDRAPERGRCARPAVIRNDGLRQESWSSQELYRLLTGEGGGYRRPFWRESGRDCGPPRLCPRPPPPELCKPDLADYSPHSRRPRAMTPGPCDRAPEQ